MALEQIPDPASAPLTIVFVRHGEKPGDDGPPHGINDQGQHDPHGLSVRGWTRAGALAGLLAHGPFDDYPHVVAPERILATKPSHEARSRREVDTAHPLGRRLGIRVEDDHGHGDEEAVRDEILRSPRPTFVVWHHGTLGHLVRSFPIANRDSVPAHWPEDRYDLFWVLSRSAGESAYTFTSLGQRLLDGDLETGS